MASVPGVFREHQGSQCSWDRGSRKEMRPESLQGQMLEAPVGLVVVQSPNCVQFFVTPMDCGTPVFPVLHYLPEFAQTHSCPLSGWYQPSHFILCHPLLLLPAIIPSIRVFSSESVLRIRWPKYCSFSFSTSSSGEYSELISFRINLFDLLTVQGDSQESSLGPQFESINSSALSLLYGPTLTSVHDYWKHKSFNYTDLCWQSDVSTF